MTNDPTPEVKALKYMESLGLHTVYQQALAARENLDKALTELSNCRDRKRALEALKFDIEMEVMEEERLKHPDMAAVHMDKHLKIAHSNSTEWRENRDLLISTQGDIEGLEYDIDILNVDIKIAVARLHELGGFFEFAAVIKQAELTRKANEASEANNANNASEAKDDGNPWK